MYNSMEEEKLLNLEYRLGLLKQIRSENNRERKNRSLFGYEVYKNKLKEKVKEKLLEYVKPSKLSQMHIIAFMGFCEKIINDEASIYIEPATRKFQEVSLDQEEKLVEIYTDMFYDDQAKKHNRFFKLQMQSPSLISLKDGRLQKRPLLGHHYDIIENPDDVDTPIGYVISNYNQAKEEENQRFVIWTQRFNFTMDGKGRVLSEDDRNPISPTIPFSMAQTDLDGSVYVDEDATEIEFTIAINAAITEIFHIMRMQGWSVPVWKKPAMSQQLETNKDGELEVGVNSVIEITTDENGQGADFYFATPSPDLSGSIEVLSVVLSAYLTSRGIDPKEINIKGESAQGFTSGWERFLALIDKFKAIKDDFTIFKKVEKQDFEIIKAWHNAYKSDKRLDKKYQSTLIPEKAYVDVSFYEPSDIQTEAETIQTNSDAETKGYQSKIMSVKRIYSYESDEEAIEHLKKMKEDEEKLEEIFGNKEPVISDVNSEDENSDSEDEDSNSEDELSENEEVA